MVTKFASVIVCTSIFTPVTVYKVDIEQHLHGDVVKFALLKIRSSRWTLTVYLVGDILYRPHTRRAKEVRRVLSLSTPGVDGFAYSSTHDRVDRGIEDSSSGAGIAHGRRPHH